MIVFILCDFLSLFLRRKVRVQTENCLLLLYVMIGGWTPVWTQSLAPVSFADLDLFYSYACEHDQRSPGVHEPDF